MDYKFLIVVPTLNSYKKLPKLIKSLKCQSYVNGEYYLLEGSNDSKNINFLNNLCSVDKRFSWIFENKEIEGYSLL